MSAPAPSSEIEIRPLLLDDLPAALAVSGASFGLDLQDAAGMQRWTRRVAFSLETDPAGGFIAERDGRPIGVAQAIQRERLWCLSLLAIDPGAQSAGAGRALLASALAYGTDSDVGLIPSSSDPRALRLYALAGFAPRPTFEATGTLDRRALPAVDPRIREAGEADLEALAAISRDIRGAPHTVELRYALQAGGRLERFADRGFAAAMPGGDVWLLVARDQEAATALLWSGLATVGETVHPSVRWITGEQDWAVQVVLRAGLQLGLFGALCVRGDGPPLRPFLPSGSFG